MGHHQPLFFLTRPKFLKMLSVIYWGLFSLIFVILLAVYAYRGIYSRYLQDDYCYGAQVVAPNNFLEAQWNSYTQPMPYNSNRYSLTLFSGIAELSGGPKLVPYLAGLSIVCWALALIYFLWEWQKYFGIKGNRSATLIAAFSILYFTLYTAPNLYQVLYWRSAMLPYLTPLIFNTFEVGIFLSMLRHEEKSILLWFVFGLVCVLSGGFSETVALWQMALWGIILLTFIESGCRRWATLKFFIAPLIGTILAIGLLAFSPANSKQLEPFQRPDLVNLMTYSLIYASDFIRVSLKGMILPFGVVAGLGFHFGIHTLPGQRMTWKRVLVRIVLSIVLCYGACVAVMIPTMLAMSAYPGDRALLPALFTLVLGVFSVGWLLARGLITSAIWQKRLPLFRVAVAFLGIFLIFYVVRTTSIVWVNLSPYQHRAEAWDLRHQSILEAKMRGEQHVVVPAFDSMAQILELYPEEGFWVNTCAARYYGVEGIAAVEGYHGVSPIFR